MDRRGDAKILTTIETGPKPSGRWRDYSLVGADAKAAEQRGYVSAEWHRSALPREQLKALSKRADGPAIRDTAIWLGAMVLFGGLGVWFWGSWLAAPCFLCYGVLYGSASASRWHECSHGTAFKTRWLNKLVHHIASFMIMRDPTLLRWSHARHHSHTLIVGRDPEIIATRPPRLAMLILNLFGLVGVTIAFRRMLRHAAGRMTDEEKDFVPESERRTIWLTARIWLAIYAGVVLSCLATASILPAMLIGLPFLYGSWLGFIFSLTQHAGLAEDVLDYRLNSRTIMMNPVFRFIYSNMNYHVEHHMFPMVPYHRLPELHAALKAEMPRPYRGLWEAYREIIPALLRQRKDPDWHVVRDLPGA